MMTENQFVHIDVNPQTLELDPGSQESAKVIITNNWHSPCDYNLVVHEVDKPTPYTYEWKVPGMRLFPRDNGSSVLTVSAPKVCKSRAGNYRVEVVVTPRIGDKDQEPIRFPLTVNVKKFCCWDGNLTKNRDERGGFTFKLTNNSNAPYRFSIVAEEVRVTDGEEPDHDKNGTKERLTFSITPNAPEVAPCATEYVDIFVRIPEERDAKQAKFRLNVSPIEIT